MNIEIKDWCYETEAMIDENVRYDINRGYLAAIKLCRSLERRLMKANAELEKLRKEKVK